MFSDDPQYFVTVLRACAKHKDLYRGIRAHADVLRTGLLEKSSDALVNMYAKCGALGEAQRVLDGLLVRDVFTWTPLIAGYAEVGMGHDALNCFERMQHDGISPDAVSFACILKACGTIGAIDKGEQIHDEIARQGLLGRDIVLGNALVDMYIKCGALETAERVLGDLPNRDVISWNALITGYTQQGKCDKALGCFKQMEREGVSPNVVSWTALISGFAEKGQGEKALTHFEQMCRVGLSPDIVTFIAVLKACSTMQAADKGEQIYHMIAGQELLRSNPLLGSALVDMYVKCDELLKAQAVLEELPTRDVATWNALIGGYAQEGKGVDALSCFKRMKDEGHSPDTVTFICVVKACASIQAVEKGEEIQDEIARHGLLLGDNVMLGNALVDMYAKCGAFTRARQILGMIRPRNAISWNTLIAGYCQHGKGEDVLDCFKQMKQDGHSADAVTFACLLKACGSIRAADKGEEFHDEIVRRGLLKHNIVLSNALVDMYSKCGALARAERMLEQLSTCDVFSWNALLGGYIQQGQDEEALESFRKMQHAGYSPNGMTFICILKACGPLGVLNKGEEIHVEIVRQQLLGDSVALGRALVDMYAKCGALEKAACVLDGLHVRDVASWTVLIAGYAQQGCCQDVYYCLQRMKREGLTPNAVTFSCMLNAYSHEGLVDDGQMYFANVCTMYGIKPDVEHYTCMVALYGRAGQLDKAIAVIRKMPSSDHSVVWHALLSACFKLQNVHVGRWAFEQAITVNKSDTASYTLMSNTYRAASMHKDADTIEAMRVENNIHTRSVMIG